MSAEPQTFDWLPEGNWVDLGYDNAPTESQLRSQVDAGEHNDAYGDLGCPDCGNVDLFWKTHSSKGQRYRCLSCEYSSNWETVKSQGDLTLQKFGLTVDCPLCGETISAYNRASIDSHFRKHKKEAAEASEPKVSESESEHEWQEEIEWNEKPKKKTDPEWEDVEWDSETRRCCECHTTERLTTIQAGTFCYDCLPINLGAEDDYWAGSVAKAIVNEMGDDYYFNEDLDEYDCLHFAQEMSEYLTQDEIPHEIQSIAGYGGEVAHAWVYVPSEGEYYDAWTPYGVSDWKDLGFWETLDYTPESFEAEVHLLPDVPMAGWYDRHDDSVNINLANKGIRNEALEDNYSGLFDTIAHEYGHQVTSHETRSPYHSEFAAFMVQTNGDFARSKLLAVIHPTCVHEIIMKLPPDSNGMISDETLDNFFSTLDFENNLDIIVQAKRFVTYSTIPEWHKEWLKHLISYVETGTSANVSFEAEDDYWAGSVAKAIVNEMGDDYYFNEDLDEYDCLHFAQEMSEYLTQDEIPHEIQSIAGYGGEVAHAWVYVPSEGEYYDAWTPYGVSDWKDLGFWETLDYTPESFEAEVHLLPDVPMAGWYDRHDDSVNINLANKGIRNEALEDNYSGLFDTIAHEYGHQVTSHETRSPYHSEFAAFMVQTNGDFARSKLLAVIHPTCVHEIIMKLPPDSNGMISDETLDNFFSTLDFENNLDIIVQAKRFVTYSTIPEWHKEWLKHLISYVETGTSANVSFEAEDNYDSTYGKAQAKIRRTLKNKIKKQAIMGTKAGQWSARKSQELKRQYEAACSKKGLQPYKGSKTKKQQDLSDWSKQKWKTASGKKSSTTGEPYFPAKAVAALKQKKLYAKAKRQKQAATKAGKQNARYSDDIRAVVKQYRAEEDSVSTQEVLNWINRPQIITESYEFPSEPVRCVYCGSDDITTDGLEAGWSGGTVTTDVTCLAEDCQATWRDYFRYVDTEIIVPTSLTLDSEDALHDEQLEIEIEGIDETYGLSSSDPEMLSVAESAVSQYQSRTDLPETFQLHTKPHFVFVSADAFGRSSHVARFRSQTASHIPIIMLSSEAIRESADQYGVSLETAVQTTVWHELGHVLCELWDMEEIYPFDNSTQEEEFAESIAESMYFQEPFQNPEV